MTPLQSSLFFGEVDASELLIENSANINTSDSWNNPTLDFAVRNGVFAARNGLENKALMVMLKGNAFNFNAEKDIYIFQCLLG
jgi:ankyrin repeat protein